MFVPTDGFTIFHVIPLVGFLCMLLGRLLERRGQHALSTWLSGTGIVLVGAATAAAFALQNNDGFFCAASLGVITVGTTLDLRANKSPNVTAF